MFLDHGFLTVHKSVFLIHQIQEVALIRRATFSSFRITKFFTMSLFAPVWGVFCNVKKRKSLLWKMHLCVYHKWSKSLGFCVNMNMCAFTHEHTGTTLHHPSTHSDNDADQKHPKSLHFRTHLDQPRNCLYLLSRISVCALLNLCWSIREWVVAARETDIPNPVLFPIQVPTELLQIVFPQETCKWVSIEISLKRNDWIFHTGSWFRPFVSWKTYPNIWTFWFGNFEQSGSILQFYLGVSR